MEKELLEKKEILLKNNEPLKLKAVPYSKGYKIEVTLNIDPNNPIHLDSLLMKVEDSNVRTAIKAFKENIIEKDLGGILLKDEA